MSNAIFRVALLATVVLTLLGGSAALAATLMTPVSVCGTFREYVAATDTQPGKITVGDQSFAISARALLKDRPAVVDPAATIGMPVCLVGEWVASQTMGRLLEEFRVSPNAATAKGGDHLPATSTDSSVLSSVPAALILLTLAAASGTLLARRALRRSLTKEA
jgi:hypothetical protein